MRHRARDLNWDPRSAATVENGADPAEMMQGLPEGGQCCWVSGGQGVLGNEGQPDRLRNANMPTRERVSVCPSHTLQPSTVTAVCAPTLQERDSVHGHIVIDQGLLRAGLVARKPMFSATAWNDRERGSLPGMQDIWRSMPQQG